MGFGEIASNNVVGYSEVGLRFGSKGAGACFVNIDSQPMNLQDLKVTGYDTEAGYEDGGISVRNGTRCDIQHRIPRRYALIDNDFPPPWWWRG